MSSSSRTDDEEEQNISDDLVVTKYKLAAEIANKILKVLVDKCVSGAHVLEICEYGDKFIIEETSKVYKKNKETKKGIAFPTCISINNCICHFSPLKSDPDITIKSNDLVKIDLGVHIDGFIAVIAQTVFVDQHLDQKIKGRIADVLLATYYCAEACQRLIKEGNSNNQVTTIIKKISECFRCKPIEGMLMHQLKQHDIEGEKSIIQNPSETQKQEHEKHDFKNFEVYGVDCLISTGDGKGKEMDARTTIFKKTDEIYNLKLRTSRAFFSEIEKKFGTMPFSLRSCDDEKKARLGVVECVNHKLMTSFPVLWEKDGEYVAHIKYTLFVTPNGSFRITSGTFDPNTCESEYKIEDPEILEILKSSGKAKSTNKKKKKKPVMAEGTGDGKLEDSLAKSLEPLSINGQPETITG